MKFREQYKKLVIDEFYLEYITKSGCIFKVSSAKRTAKCYLEKAEIEKLNFKFQEIQFHKTEFTNHLLAPKRTWFCIMGKNGGNP